MRNTMWGRGHVVNLYHWTKAIFDDIDQIRNRDAALILETIIASHGKDWPMNQKLINEVMALHGFYHGYTIAERLSQRAVWIRK